MRAAAASLLGLLCAALLCASPAAAEPFGFKSYDLNIFGPHAFEEPGPAFLEAGRHPYGLKSEFSFNTELNEALGETIPAGQVKDVTGELPVGLTGNPFATAQCSAVDFATLVSDTPPLVPNCPDSAVIGVAFARVATSEGVVLKTGSAVYNLVPPPGVAAKIGFLPSGSSPVTIDLGIKDVPPYNLTFEVPHVTQMFRVFEAGLEVWGNPVDKAHDDERGTCGAYVEEKENGIKSRTGDENCTADVPNVPFITLPRACTGPLSASFRAVSWLGDVFEGSIPTHGDGGPGEPRGMEGCSALGFAPEVSAQPTSDRAESPTGLDFHLDNSDEGLTNPGGTARSDLKKAVVALPEGMTINPSQAEGLGVCTQADFARESAFSAFGEGCPAASKIGTVEVETPLLEGKILKGSLFVAAPHENPFGTLIALYMTFAEPDLGIGIKLAGKVEPDPVSGRIVATFDDLPQQPFSHFRLHFREGGRSPLITPPRCGTHVLNALLTPWANPGAPLPLTASFEIHGGPAGGPCPSGDLPFEPGFEAGSLNNHAGSYSPFEMRLTRRDGDQDLTRFDATLPPGEVGRLAGVSQCPDAQIAAAEAKTGKAELASPSCPLGSRIGAVTAGAGVGSQLTYVKGTLYLAGPFGGAPLSVVAIVPAVAGPFDVGTVVVRQALQIDPRTARVSADGAHSDPIPHILAGIPLRVRDIRVSVDRSQFTLNPTSCAEEQTAAQIWGGGQNPFSTLDDSPVPRSARFQAAGCRGLGFRPRLALRLKGGTRRGGHPALRAVVRARPGDANIEGAVVRLPRSAFLEQAHIRTICTRVQFAARGGNGAGCPEGSVYGHVTAYTPLLDEPLKGPVYLRSSNHNLPDLVFALHGLVDFEAVGRIDSKHGGIRTTFTKVPDAPISRVILHMQGGRKGLIVNSRSLCAHRSRVSALFSAHNNARRTLHPLLAPSGCHKHRKRHRGHRR